MSISQPPTWIEWSHQTRTFFFQVVDQQQFSLVWQYDLSLIVSVDEFDVGLGPLLKQEEMKTRKKIDDTTKRT